MMTTMTRMLFGVRCVDRAARRLLWAMTALVLLASVLLPAPALAAKNYVWKKNNDGVWKNRANWTCIFASDPNDPCAAGLGFPNGSADEAQFLDAYDRDQVVNLAGTARVGHINFGNSPFSVRIQPLNGDLNAQIISDTQVVPGEPTTIRSEGNGGAAGLVTHELRVPIVNESPIVVTTAAGTEVLFSNDIGPFAFDVTTNGAGTVFLRHATSYTGRTIVQSGSLVLDSPDVNAPTLVGSELLVGDGLGPFSSADVEVVRPNQISDSMRVTVGSDGRIFLFPQAHHRLGDLIVNGGSVHAAFANLEMANLTLATGRLSVGGGHLHISGNVTASGALSEISGTAGGETATIEPQKTFTVGQGARLLMRNIGIIGANAGLTKSGSGTLTLDQTGVPNTYPGTTTVLEGRLVLTGTDGRIAVFGNLVVGGGPGPAFVDQETSDSIQSPGIFIRQSGVLTTRRSQAFPTVGVADGGALAVVGRVVGATVSPSTVSVDRLTLTGGLVFADAHGVLRLTGELHAQSTPTQSALIGVGLGTNGRVVIDPPTAALPIVTTRGPQRIDLLIDAPIEGIKGLTKQGAGVAQLSKPNALTGRTTIAEGTLLVTGSLALSPVTLTGGLLGGTGTVGLVTATLPGTGSIAPGLSPGRLVTGGLALAAGTTVALELAGLTPGTGYDQLDVLGPVSLGGATLGLAPAASFVPTATTQLALVLNDGADPVIGTFAGLPEGAEVTLRGRKFTLSYRGGDGNDVVLTAKADDPDDPDDPTDPPPPPDPTDVNYYLSEGATGTFFDADILLANPTGTAAPVTLVFAKENGEQIVATRVVPAQARLTVHVDQIPGLEGASASVRVRSDARVPLVVERSMFWDAAAGPYSAGHTGGAVEQPARQWFFAEGSQGSFFDTFVLVINPNPTPTDVTFTFLREHAAPVVKTVTVGATTRLTLHAGEVPEIRDQSFGIAVEATQPIMAERSMYFGRTARGVSGGTTSAGVTAPAKAWFLAEGATGTFFTTFVLLSNPQPTEAHVTLTYLLLTGEVVTVEKTLPAHGRLTTNIAAEGDPRLTDAAMSTVVASDVPIIAERSMYWLGAVAPWGEGHNSFGVVDAGTRWGLAEGRTGGPLTYHTYILLANPQTTAATVTVTYLRETGAPIVETYTVAPTSRFNIDTNAIAGLEEAAFGALIEVTNDVPIVVERSLYWDAHGFPFSGGTNATALRLAPATASTSTSAAASACAAMSCP